MKPLVLGIDVGTSTAKAVLADLDGEELFTASRRYGYAAPKPGWAEQRPEDWWDAVVGAVRAVVEAAGAPERVAAIAVSGQGVAAVLLGDDGTPLRPAILWMDCRSDEQTRRLMGEAGRFVAIAGKAPGAYNVEPKLMWVREHEPQVWQRIWKVTTTTGYVTYRLTGRPIMNHSDAGVLLSYDLERQDWSDELLGVMELPRRYFCDLAPCDQIVGTLTGQAARELGLPAGIPVAAGGEDTSAAGLSVGAVEPGHAFLSLGTASTLYVPARGTPVDRNLLTFPHVVPGTSLIGGSMISGGGAFAWLAKLVFGGDVAAGSAAVRQGAEGSESAQSAERAESVKTDERGERAVDAWIENLSREAERAAAGAGNLLFLPYLAGELQPVNDPLARGVFFGLHFGTTRGDLARAVLEGVAFAIHHNAVVMSRLGVDVTSFRAVGGPANNPLWRQIIADVTGREVMVYDDKAGAPLGDAALAAAAVGLVQHPLHLVERHVRAGRSCLPNEENHARYRRLFDVYLELYPRLRDLFAALKG